MFWTAAPRLCLPRLTVTCDRLHVNGAAETTEHGMHRGLSAENKTQDEGGPVQRAGPTVPGVLLSAAGPAAVHRAVKQASKQCTSTPITAASSVAHPCQAFLYAANGPSCVFTRFRAACVLCFVRYIHIIMVFWSFLAGVVTFYCSLGPESLLPNIFMSIKPKSKVGQRARVTDFTFY